MMRFMFDFSPGGVINVVPILQFDNAPGAPAIVFAFTSIREAVTFVNMQSGL